MRLLGNKDRSHGKVSSTQLLGREKMKIPMVLFQSVAEELATWCSTGTLPRFQVDVSNDVAYARKRFEEEGDSFLTITLPAFCKDFERSLDRGYVDSSVFVGYSRRGELPKFLGSFMKSIFNENTGILSQSPKIDAILAVRQLTLLYSKVLLECSDARKKKAIDGFLACEQDLIKADSERTEGDTLRFSRMSALLWRDLFTTIDLAVYDGKVLPKHGPGKTADRLDGNAKFDQFEWTERLEEVFPFQEYLLPSIKDYSLIERVEILEPVDERPVKVVLVPKTPKTPRIIAIEPTCMQYMQQGLREMFYEGIERDELLKNFVGFTDQIPNQEMACEGSYVEFSPHGLATLDLSEASDRVSNQLVEVMFANHRNVAQAVQATRSRSADLTLHGKGVIPLAKFASMGSALCFPMEAMVFLTVIFLGIEKAQGRQLTRRSLKGFVGSVRVYGDDIIVPVDYVLPVIRELETFGFKVNDSKSFWTGKFRESCGKEYYAGHDVSVVKVRRDLPSSRDDVQGVVSLVSLRNQFYWSGMWHTARRLDESIRKLLPRFPDVETTSPILGRETVLSYQPERFHPSYQTPLVQGFMVRVRAPKSDLSGWGALLKFFLKRGPKPIFDRNHLERHGRSEVRIKLGWGSPY